jgi:phosphate-selective porin OprO and OprP
MKNKRFLLALLASGSMTIAGSPALAQEQAGDVPIEAAPTEDQARAAFLEAQIESLQQQIDALKAQMTKATPSWKGAPLTEDKEEGWSFKPFGRLQYDVAHVGSPDGVSNGGLGFSNELRRGRIGVEGSIPGGFGYKVEVDFADNGVDVTDAFLSYKASDEIGLVIGQHNNFQSMEELTSSRFSSFIERAAFTDAFNFERRVGLSGTFTAGDFIAQAGVFTDNIDDLGSIGDDDNAVSLDGRLVFAPKLGETQLHLGGSAHWRDNGDVGDLVETRYRQRPLVHSTDVRFLATPARNVQEETNYGLEAAAIHGPFHAAGEVHWLTADDDSGSSPTYFGGYAELGWFITGETRGYKGGRFDRTKVLKPVGDGGLGALQLNLRYDHLDLNDEDVIGGKQAGYQASLIWIPQDYVRFMLNYARLSYDDAAIAAEDGDRDYSIDVFGARAQVDF